MLTSSLIATQRSPSVREGTVVVSRRTRVARQAIAAALAKKAGPFSVVALAALLRERDLKRYTGSTTHYTSVRFCRTLIFVLGDARFADTEEDLACYWCMSANMTEKAKWWGVLAYDDAIECRNKLRAKLGDNSYSFADLACFVCLASVSAKQ